jgi:serine/threonine protein kinase
MGEVYRARDTRLNRSVAIKVLPASFASRPLRRFEQEARTVAALNHRNILGLHEIGSQNGTSSLVSEFLEGNTLREQLADEALPTRIASNGLGG